MLAHSAAKGLAALPAILMDFICQRGALAEAR